MRNSLILTGLTFRTFSAVVSDCVLPSRFVHEALPTRSPLKAAGPEVTLKVALTLAPGATGSANVFDVPVRLDHGGPLPGHGNAQLDARRGRPGGIRERHGGVLRGPRRERLESRRRGGCRRRRQAQPRHVVPGGHDVGLHQLVGGVRREGARGRHRAFIEGALRADAVVAAVAQQDGSLLAHRVIGGVDARSVEHDRQGALLRVAAHRGPVVRFALGHRGHESPGDVRQVLCRVWIHPG